jgi:hypothetical protein
MDVNTNTRSNLGDSGQMEGQLQPSHTAIEAALSHRCPASTGGHLEHFQGRWREQREQRKQWAAQEGLRECAIVPEHGEGPQPCIRDRRAWLPRRGTGDPSETPRARQGKAGGKSEAYDE